MPDNKERPPISVRFPAVALPHPDGGFVFKPGKAVVESGEVRVAEFARLTGLSVSRVEALCMDGTITSRRLSPRLKSPYVISRSEVQRFLNIGRIEAYEN